MVRPSSRPLPRPPQERRGRLPRRLRPSAGGAAAAADPRAPDATKGRSGGGSGSGSDSAAGRNEFTPAVALQRIRSAAALLSGPSAASQPRLDAATERLSRILSRLRDAVATRSTVSGHRRVSTGEGGRPTPEAAAHAANEEPDAPATWARLLALALHHLATSQKLLGRVHPAVRHAEESHSIAVSIGAPSPATMLNLVVLHTGAGNFERAVDIADDAINVMAAQEGVCPEMWAAVYHNRAVAMLHLLMRFGEGSASRVLEVLKRARSFVSDPAACAFRGTRAAELLLRIRETERLVLEEFGQAAPNLPPLETQRTSAAVAAEAGKSKALPPPVLPNIDKRRVLAAVDASRRAHQRLAQGAALRTSLPASRKTSTAHAAPSSHPLPPQAPLPAPSPLLAAAPASACASDVAASPSPQPLSQRSTSSAASSHTPCNTRSSSCCSSSFPSGAEDAAAAEAVTKPAAEHDAYDDEEFTDAEDAE